MSHAASDAGIDFDFEGIHNWPLRQRRLSAGADKDKPEQQEQHQKHDNDDGKDEPEDDLPLDEDEEDPAAKKKLFRFFIPEPTPEPEPEPEVTTKSAVVLLYIKILCLAAVWCILAILLALHPIDQHDPKLLIIPPSVTKEYSIPFGNVTNALGVDIVGPFLALNDVHTTKDNTAPSLNISVQRFYYDESNTVVEKKTVSETWRLFIVPADNFDHIVPSSDTNVFSLERESNEDKEKTSKLFLVLSTNIQIDTAVKLMIEPKPLDTKMGIILGALVLLFLYIMIVWEVINRTFASIISAVLALSIMALLRSRPTLGTIMSWVDMETLMLLFGMMILVGILSDSGVFDYFAVYAYRISKGHVWPLVNSLCLFTASLSAFLDSVTMMLLISPIIIRLCEVMEIDPVLVLMFLVFYANIGAASTPVGDPPNIIITTNPFIVSHNVNFGNFMLHTLPCVVLVMIQTYIQLRLMFRNMGAWDQEELDTKEQKDLRRNLRMWERAAASISPYSKHETVVRDTLLKKANRLKRKLKRTIRGSKRPAPNYEETLKQLSSTYGIRNKTLLVKSVIVFTFVIALFILHSVHDLHHLSLGWAALTGSILLLVIADVQDMEAILSRVEWSTLIFFASLFILMEALSELGLIEVVGNAVVQVILQVEKKHRLTVAILILVWVAAVASAFLDNIPVTTMLIRIVISLSQNKDLDLPLHPLVWSLALGACFGGNGTLIAASANVVCAGVSEQHGYSFTFMRFFRIGFPLMIGNTIVTTIYLLVCHVLFEWHSETHTQK